VAEGKLQRLSYIDWMRGFACLVMFQTHCYDSWLSPAARHTQFFMWSQLVGTLPAPLFLTLAGISCALMMHGLRKRGATAAFIAKRTIRRGAEILALGYVFRLQEFLLGQPYAPWTDLLRVDILNIIGISIVLMGLVCWAVAALWSSEALASWRIKNTAAAAIAALAISMLTPPLWTTWQPKWLPWYLESYINGVHTFGKPQPWLFPLFPWAAFAFGGLAAGFILLTDWARSREARAVAVLAACGAVMGGLALWLDEQPFRLYAIYDFWHTSPNFFLIRLGVMFLILFVAYAWCRWGAGQWGFSPLIQTGQTSLLVYWVHIEFVYGGFSILAKGKQTIPMASLGLAIIFVSMVLLSIVRTRLKGKGRELANFFRGAARAVDA
jgi:uncharacterized membrane protein